MKTLRPVCGRALPGGAAPATDRADRPARATTTPRPRPWTGCGGCDVADHAVIPCVGARGVP